MEISVCFPTFNRKDSIVRRIKEIRSYQFPLPILVSDNGSTDGTLEAIKSLRNDNVIAIANNGDGTFGSNLLNALKHCPTEWAILCSDEDALVPEAIPEILSYISNQEVDMILGSIASGGANLGIKPISTGTPSFNQIFSYVYMSGIVMKVPRYLEAINLLEEHRPDNLFINVFTGTCFLWLAHARNTLYSTSTELVSRKENLPTNFATKKHGNKRIMFYATVEGRWQQYIGAAKYLHLIETLCNSFDGWEDRVKVMRARQRASLLPFLRLGVVAEEKALSEQFREESLLKYFNEGIVRESKRLLGG